jgi:hypothetical protein
MDPTALLIEIFGVGSLTLAFAKYTLARRKMMHAEDNMKNHGYNVKLNNSLL